MRPLFAVAIFVSAVLALAVFGIFFDTEMAWKPEPEARQPQQEQQQQQRPEPVEATKVDSLPIEAPEPRRESGARHGKASDSRHKIDPIAVPEAPRELGTRHEIGSDSRNKTDQIKIKYTVPRNTVHRRI